MSEAKHTPTPFRFDGHGVNDANGRRIAKLTECGSIPQCLDDMSSNPELDRVGNMLAAAPELLEACRTAEANLAPAYSSDHIVLQRLRAAITKATA